MNMQTKCTLIGLGLVTSVLTGCGNLTVGGFGETTVVVSADAPEPVPVGPRSTLNLATTSPLLSDHDDDDPEGELRVEFYLFLEGADGSEVALSRDELEVQADLQGQVEVDAVDAVAVPARRYTGLKIVFIQIKAEVSAGLFVGGQPVTGEIRVEFDDIELPISKPLELDIRDGEMVELLVDMNAGTWLSAVDPDLLVVAQQIFQDAITVEIRQGN